ncbi:MAG: YqeG family HAD IIIA-type phosphatase [Coriobacteriia bacterium]|nr:YqeG family HAD IIIA-type phosphatase [Coriobacteriia bacterium]
MALLRPDRYFARLTCIDVQKDLIDQGFQAVLLDIDNTVRSRETDSVPDDVRGWLDRARDAGLKLCLLSNSWHESAFRFSELLGIPVVAKSCKPLIHGYFQACAKVGVPRKRTVMVGDQILTDVLGAHFAGMPAYLVVPLSDVNIKSALWQRALERRILAGSVPEGEI